MLYDLDLKKQWDDYSALETATREGIEKGIEKGIAKGAEEKSVEFVRNLIVKFGFTDSQIVEAGDVSLDFVQKVRASIKKLRNTKRTVPVQNLYQKNT